MTIVVLRGGLGNQLFQLAAGLEECAGKLGQLAVDERFLRRDKNRRVPQLESLGLSVRRASVVDHAAVRFLSRVARSRRYPRRFLENRLWRYVGENGRRLERGRRRTGAMLTVLDGYWQRYEYADGLAGFVRERLAASALPGTAELAREAAGCSSLAVHVRRGDYVTDAAALAVHGVCDIGYYHRAIDLIESQARIEKLFVFSDDLEWAIANLGLDSRAVYVNRDRSLRDVDEFRIMAACRHFIIANSTFSWWAARLSDSPKKLVVAPRRWFRDPRLSDERLVPPGWIRVE